MQHENSFLVSEKIILTCSARPSDFDNDGFNDPRLSTQELASMTRPVDHSRTFVSIPWAKFKNWMYSLPYVVARCAPGCSPFPAGISVNTRSKHSYTASWKPSRNRIGYLLALRNIPPGPLGHRCDLQNPKTPRIGKSFQALFSQGYYRKVRGDT